METFQVIFSKPCSNGNHFVKLQRKGAVVSNKGQFGNTSLQSSETYFVFGSIPQTVGAQIPLDPSKWRIELKPFTIPTGEKAGEIVQLKYLAEFVG